MIDRRPIRLLLATATLLAAGCATQPPQPPTPLAQDELAQFLAGSRDARFYGITIYRDTAGARFEFANRVHPSRFAEMPMASRQGVPFPLVRAKTAALADCPLLLDSTARQNWLLLGSTAAMEYVPFEPPMGEYADHVVAEIPGYAGRANKIVLDSLHVESPVFLVPPAHGRLGSLARLETLGNRIQAVMGAALMRSFAFIRFDFPGHRIGFSTSDDYQPPKPSAVLAELPLQEWRGRPVVQARLGGEPIALLLDTAGDFDLVVPRTASVPGGALELDKLTLADPRVAAAADLGLPENFPARLGLGVLARYVVTLDYTHRRVWFEDPRIRRATAGVPSTDKPAPAPVNYRGITR